MILCLTLYDSLRLSFCVEDFILKTQRRTQSGHSRLHCTWPAEGNFSQKCLCPLQAVPRESEKLLEGMRYNRGEEQLSLAGEKRWALTDIVGLEDGLGVECLSGSGAIASAFSKAFREGLTITMVSGRTVGIGAYLARLGRRCVQRADQPIILTGYSALNKLLGREVYTSHMQLGGPKVRLLTSLWLGSISWHT